ncbi:MarR family winged helix-turn-helix transcriptional regulator [Jeotgalibacillus proteolyticus]|uniref:MarR family transcriptional regulator n=1 Tax=Jeotgalibacillus proteolyticus TaxID=2082395 RepID=A0A2S5G9Y8_9BACL|nr:MarR family transcriptional regulator [Jeotgalibacillus proteolyticus]PPA69806.1 MarR family transcriptional regulator [Jeotgalibacillus proteolyticus]
MNEESLKTIELEMAVLIRRVASINSRREESLLRSAYLLLLHISTNGTAGVKTLAADLQLDISTVSRQAASLEQKGYVEKAPCPADKRAYFYQITELGAKELQQYKEARMKKLTMLLEDWSQDECDNFGELLKKFNYAIKEL